MMSPLEGGEQQPGRLAERNCSPVYNNIITSLVSRSSLSQRGRESQAKGIKKSSYFTVLFLKINFCVKIQEFDKNAHTSAHHEDLELETKFEVHILHQQRYNIKLQKRNKKVNVKVMEVQKETVHLVQEEILLEIIFLQKLRGFTLCSSFKKNV